ncbi:MAG: hypothetical protein UR39_C0002G0008 [Candidatus Woesebacteria bacterium GW2011_GWA1_33_30]|uniref:Uncharacterized protein n=1 Tax=Candidatus Woesebacteria bacterium GW2011_GWA2_33_28 TaxID=1618561 RepID=A0A0G0C9S2_9BACT|nr:MAG: hypothetical protein UR38_C0002G0008 [Candidatus Woesebacteria bacterium GW2011_GWA2_33_28]KKP48718.1 MAG: hypothetical protein UR39_C0002G0008 [Candidatus Woesebacteria bacterium GW2011_GWA1_33_30]KKP49991.1 MAG: hypothetical protein UR40_C0002G0008 [Microgenomates group bacterium GW2011_GWC1_33_32]KKP51762.1 MAG: hypothetical protein UR44_C0006G0008 [Candidatus Woesebacteria bacterium GW2011_GWB1_33_38]KKP56777.1 MAG: hypothetical protein UR48_C0029G0008 [Microgenomates group bacteriu
MTERSIVIAGLTQKFPGIDWEISDLNAIQGAVGIYDDKTMTDQYFVSGESRKNQPNKNTRSSRRQANMMKTINKQIRRSGR